MIIERIDPISGEQMEIDSIKLKNTIICNIPVEDFEEIATDVNFKEECSEIRADEKLQEIDLEPIEKFKALKSWVSGIADAGMKSLRISLEAKAAANKIYPISSKLMNFLYEIDPELIYSLIFTIKRESEKMGLRKDEFLEVNLTPILSIFLKNIKEYNKVDDLKKKNWTFNQSQGMYYSSHIENIMELIMELEPPLELFTKHSRYGGFLKSHAAEKYRTIPYLFKLSGAPLDFAFKSVEIDITKPLTEIKKILARKYKLCLITEIQLIYRKLLFGRDLFFDEFGVLPEGEAISVIVAPLTNKPDFLKTTLLQMSKDYTFRLVAVPPELAMKKISIDIFDTLEEIRKKVARNFQLAPGVWMYLIYRGNAIEEHMYFSNIGIKPTKDAVSILVTSKRD
jgi:hypothetical protein